MLLLTLWEQRSSGSIWPYNENHAGLLYLFGVGWWHTPSTKCHFRLPKLSSSSYTYEMEIIYPLFINTLNNDISFVLITITNKRSLIPKSRRSSVSSMTVNLNWVSRHHSLLSSRQVTFSKAPTTLASPLLNGHFVVAPFLSASDTLCVAFSIITSVFFTKKR